MTTTVIIQAHCVKTKEVLVEMKRLGVPSEEYTVQDGDKLTVHVYDDREVTISEIPK